MVYLYSPRPASIYASPVVVAVMRVTPYFPNFVRLWREFSAHLMHFLANFNTVCMFYDSRKQDSKRNDEAVWNRWPAV